MTVPRANALVFRVVALAWLAGWYWKAWTYAGYYLDEIWSYPLRYDRMPSVLVSPALASVAWLAPVLVVGAIAVPRRPVMRAAALVMTTAALACCLHVETCNDATFVTSFWVAVWLTWFTANAHRRDASLYLHARALAQLTVGLVFLGAAVGKLTGGYITGEALYHLYFLQKPSWPYPWLRDALSPEALHTVAVWFSRVAIVIELAIAVNPLVPFRIAAPFAIGAMVVMVAVSTWYLVSVMACLAGLLVALRWCAPGMSPDGGQL